MALKAVIFDMDETLLDWSRRSADRLQVRRMHLQKLYDHLAAGHSLPDIQTFGEIYMSVLSQRWTSIDPSEGKAPRYVDVLREVLHRLELPVDTLDFVHLQSLIVGFLQSGVTAFPDSKSVLKTLRAAGIRTGLLTNAPYPMSIRDVELQTLKLLDLLDVCMTAEDAGYRKPHPKAFKAVLLRLGVLADEAVFVGDDLQDDIKARSVRECVLCG